MSYQIFMIEHDCLLGHISEIFIASNLLINIYYYQLRLNHMMFMNELFKKIYNIKFPSTM